MLLDKCKLDAHSEMAVLVTNMIPPREIPIQDIDVSILNIGGRTNWFERYMESIQVIESLNF